MISLFPNFLVFGIPPIISLVILVGLLVAGFAEMRNGHIGRVAIFLNVLLLWQIFYLHWTSLNNLYQIYLNVGSFVGLIAIISYIPATRFKLPTEFYKFSYLLYGSLSIILVIFGAMYFKVPLI